MKWGDAVLKIAEQNPDIAMPDTVTDVTPAAAELAKSQRAANRSALADRFERIWRAANGPTLTPEYQFHPERRWRADYCHEPTRLLIELEGGTWRGGRHNRGRGYAEDCAKYNAALVAGYSVFRLATGMVTAENVQMILDHIEREATR